MINENKKKFHELNNPLYWYQLDKYVSEDKRQNKVDYSKIKNNFPI